MSDEKQDAQIAPETNQSAVAVESTHNESLPPWLLNPEDIKDPEQKKLAEDLVKTWMSTFKKDLHALLSKNGLKTFQMSFIHPGTKHPIILSAGMDYWCCRLAVHAAKTLKEQIDNELTV